MRNVLLAASLVIGLAIGVGISQVRSNSPPSHEAGISSSSSHEPPATVVAKQPVPTETAPTVVSDGSTETVATDLATVLGRFSVQTYERGEGVIQGSVAELDGTPIAGVRVTAVVWGTTPGVDYKEAHQAPLEEYIRQEIDQYHYDRAMMSSAWTDEQGSFAIDGIRSDRDYHLIATRESYVFETESARHISAGQSARLTGFPAAPVTIEVIRADGTMSDLYGTISLWSTDSAAGSRQPDRLPWDRRSPTILLPVVFSSLAFIALDGCQSAQVELELAFGVPSEATLTVPNLLMISGTVEGGTGFSSYVTCTPLAPGETVRGSQDWSRSRSSMTDRPVAGRFAFRGLQPGRYQLDVAGPGNSSPPRVVDLGSTSIEVSLVAPYVDPQQYIVVTATGPDGKPATGVTFRGRPVLDATLQPMQRYDGSFYQIPDRKSVV